MQCSGSNGSRRPVGRCTVPLPTVRRSGSPSNSAASRWSRPREVAQGGEAALAQDGPPPGDGAGEVAGRLLALRGKDRVELLTGPLPDRLQRLYVGDVTPDTPVPPQPPEARSPAEAPLKGFRQLLDQERVRERRVLLSGAWGRLHGRRAQHLQGASGREEVVDPLDGRPVR